MVVSGLAGCAQPAQDWHAALEPWCGVVTYNWPDEDAFASTDGKGWTEERRHGGVPVEPVGPLAGTTSPRLVSVTWTPEALPLSEVAPQAPELSIQERTARFSARILYDVPLETVRDQFVHLTTTVLGLTEAEARETASQLKRGVPITVESQRVESYMATLKGPFDATPFIAGLSANGTRFWSFDAHGEISLEGGDFKATVSTAIRDHIDTHDDHVLILRVAGNGRIESEYASRVPEDLPAAFEATRAVAGRFGFSLPQDVTQADSTRPTLCP